MCIEESVWFNLAKVLHMLQDEYAKVGVTAKERLLST